MYKEPNRKSQNCTKASNMRKSILRNPEKPLLYNNTNKIPASNLQDQLRTETQLTAAESNSNQYHEPRLNKMKELKDKFNSIELNAPMSVKANLIEQSRAVANREVWNVFYKTIKVLLFKLILDFFKTELSFRSANF